MMGSEFKDSDDEDIMTKCVRNDSEDFCDKDRFARENHSEIERRRRNKMTAYIAELSDMVPACNSLARKPDKLTILRMAVAHMKSLRGSSNPNNDSAYKPSFLTDQELKHLLLEAADGFLFVVHCDTGTIIYASDTLISVLGHKQDDWSGSSIFDYLHPDDVNKVREQLYSSWDYNNGTNNTSVVNNSNTSAANLTSHSANGNCSSHSTTSTSTPLSINNNSNNNRVLDLKTGTIKKEGHHQGSTSARFCMGTRRGFICRIKCGHNEPLPQNTMRNHPRSARAMLGPSKDGEQYAVLHCTGYIKHWPPSGSTSNAIDKVAAAAAATTLNSNTSNGTVGLNNGTGNNGVGSHPTQTSSSHTFERPLKGGGTAGPPNTTTGTATAPTTSNFCLVAIGRLQVASAPNISDIVPPAEGQSVCEFVSRHDVSGPNDLYNFTFVDQRVKDVLGYQTQEILSKSCFDFYHPDDVSHMKDTFEQVIKMKGQMISVVYRFKHKSGEWLYLRSNLYAFLNPYSEALEFVISNNSLANSSKRHVPPRCDVVDRGVPPQHTDHLISRNVGGTINHPPSLQTSPLTTLKVGGHPGPDPTFRATDTFHRQRGLDVGYDSCPGVTATDAQHPPPLHRVPRAAAPASHFGGGAIRYDGMALGLPPSSAHRGDQLPNPLFYSLRPGIGCPSGVATTDTARYEHGDHGSAVSSDLGIDYGPTTRNGVARFYCGEPTAISDPDSDELHFVNRHRGNPQHPVQTRDGTVERRPTNAFPNHPDQFFRGETGAVELTYRDRPTTNSPPYSNNNHSIGNRPTRAGKADPSHQQWLNGGFSYDEGGMLLGKAGSAHLPTPLPFDYGHTVVHPMANSADSIDSGSYVQPATANHNQVYTYPHHSFASFHEEQCDPHHTLYHNAPAPNLVPSDGYPTDHPSYFYTQNSEMYPSIHSNTGCWDPLFQHLHARDTGSEANAHHHLTQSFTQNEQGWNLMGAGDLPPNRTNNINSHNTNNNNSNSNQALHGTQLSSNSESHPFDDLTSMLFTSYNNDPNLPPQ